jgi:5-methyltetrahydrofolate--homocysteine methyltransferase
VTFYERLDRGDLVLGDGAMGTMLQDVGLDDGGAPELWNVERPDPVAEILAGYAEAGAQYLTTNTFGGTAPRLQLHGLEDRVEELSRCGAAVARGVADRYGILVAGDVGPTGEILFPLGVLEQDEAQRLFEAQIAGLAAGGADFILIETLSALEEAEAAVRAAQAVAPQLPIAITMSFDTNLRTMMGVTPAQAVTTISSWGPRVVGANCGRGPDEIETIMSQMAEARPDGVHLMAQSNAGLPKLVGDSFAYDGTPEVMAGYARRARELGVAVIGGCCGSTPAHIAAMRDALAISA